MAMCMSGAELIDVPKDIEKLFRFLSESDLGDVAEGSANTDAELQQYVLRKARLLIARSANLPSDAAYDLRQRAFLRYYKLTDEQREQIKDPRAYLYSIIKNEFFDYIQEQGIGSITQLEAAEERGSRFQTPDERKSIESNILLQAIWAQLDGEEQRLFDLMIQGYTSKELALRIGISPSAARKRISRLRDVLKELLTENRAQSG